MTNSMADITQARAILAIGTNTTEQHPVLSLQIKQAVEKHGAQLIVADPRSIELTAFATLHLQLEAGTNIALLNGLAHVILAENLHDAGFVAARTENFEAREDDAAQVNLERAVRLVCADCPLHDYSDIEKLGFEIPENELPAEVYIPAWRRLGMVYHARRNFEDAIAILEELLAWGEAHDVAVPLEAYYVTATDYYYLDRAEDGTPLCNIAIPRAFEALDIYERTRMDDPNALTNILSVIVLCRDYAQTPPTVAFQFPEGYEEPDVIVRRPGTGDDQTDSESETEQ